MENEINNKKDSTNIILTKRTEKRDVYWSEEIQKWCAEMTLDGKVIPLGNFDNLDDAIKARRDGPKYYKDFNKNV